jgi:D-alanyl-lipoteichoic acid acyltransferase DltB (MBOAT superfamily)
VLVTILLLPGLSLLIHFGLFNVLAGLWRLCGADCRALFRDPLKSTSLHEFWSRRWNLAFSQMTALSVFRPLKGIVGDRMATMSAFLFSGLLHELAISLPARSGYGLPLLYFALHATAMYIENALARAGSPVDSVRWIGRLWTMAWLVLPLPILFHQPFLRGCVWPLIGLTDG